MQLGLAGKVAIVTGGSAGIGAACSRTLHDEGVHVVMVARNEARLQAAVQAIRSDGAASAPAMLLPVAGDLRQPATVERAVDETLRRFGRIDILVNNAGSARAGRFLELPDKAYLEAWELKLLGYIRMVRAVLPAMTAQRDGRIVNIVGGAARTPTPTFLPGSTANAALINFTRGIARELADHNIRIVAISPGSTNTERAQQLTEQRAAATGKSVAAVRAEAVRAIPLGHMVDPMEIAALTALVVSDRLSSLTGTEIIIDGGQTPGM